LGAILVNTSNRSKQSGAALAVGLIMLLVMTVMILATARSSVLDFLMAVNSQNANEALQQAEDAVLRGEQRIVTDFAGIPTTDFTADAGDGLYLDGEIDVNTVDWSGIDHETDGEDEDQRAYIVEYVGPATLPGGSLAIGAGAASSIRYIYRVSGEGASSRSAARVVQTIFATMD
jgi:type IV pilus assembly protein PilX